MFLQPDHLAVQLGDKHARRAIVGEHANEPVTERDRLDRIAQRGVDGDERGGIVGAVLLVCVTVGAMGMTIGHVASAASHSAPAQQLTISHIQTMERDTRTASRTFTVVQHRAQWDI